KTLFIFKKLIKYLFIYLKSLDNLSLACDFNDFFFCSDSLVFVLANEVFSSEAFKGAKI
ncbi:hypothetical protein Mgra_00004522, partial [Meloidogyne graminicola]